MGVGGEATRGPVGWRRAVGVGGGLLCLLPVASPVVALTIGATIGLGLGDPFGGWSRYSSGMVLKVAVVGLGFGLSLSSVVETGRVGLFLMGGGVLTALTMGLALGKWIGVERDSSALIAGGTAICGGSAIAAMAPALGASSASTGVALATVFTLNGMALYVFPLVGHGLGLSQGQFGLWAAVGIHDTSSVVGAAAQYGTAALELATVLKLTRALWIIPLTIGVSWFRRRSAEGGADSRTPIPWFIGLFVAASTLRTVLPGMVTAFDLLNQGGRRLLVLSLFLVGLNIRVSMLKQAGFRPLVQGVVLWLAMAASSLALVWTFDPRAYL